MGTSSENNQRSASDMDCETGQSPGMYWTIVLVLALVAVARWESCNPLSCDHGHYTSTRTFALLGTMWQRPTKLVWLLSVTCFPSVQAQSTWQCGPSSQVCQDVDGAAAKRAYGGHPSCHGVAGVCGSSGCNTEAQIQACCLATSDTCTAYYGTSSTWWTFHGPCQHVSHQHPYRICWRPSPPPPPPLPLSPPPPPPLPALDVRLGVVGDPVGPARSD